MKASDGDVKVNKLDNVKITTVTKPASPDFASSADGQ